MEIQRMSLLELSANNDLPRLVATLNSRIKCQEKNGTYMIQRSDDLIGFIIGQIAISFILGETNCI